MTIQLNAGALAAALVTATRNNGVEYVRLHDGAPEWMQRVIHNAHADGSMLPDDWRYSAIRSVARAISEIEDGADLSDVAHETCDSLVDVYTGDLTAWLASRADRSSYCDDAVEEWGRAENTIKLLQMGQFWEYREIWDSLISNLADVDA